MEEPIRPMNLGEIFERTVKVIGRASGRTFIVAAIFIVPSMLLLYWSLTSFLSSIGDMSDATAAARVTAMFTQLPLITLGTILCLLGCLGAWIAVADIAGAEMMGEEITWQQALFTSLRRNMWRLAGQQFLVSISMFGLLMVVAIVVGLTKSAGAGMAIVSLLVLIAAYLGVFYLGIRWAFAGPVLACEDRGIIESLRRSWALVEGRWWRTFGILLLMGLVTEIVLGALSSPVFFFGIGRITRDLVRPSARPNLAEYIGSIGPVFMLCGVLVFVLLLMIVPVYTTVIYFDARARNGEFEDPDPNVDIQIVGEW